MGDERIYECRKCWRRGPAPDQIAEGISRCEHSDVHEVVNRKPSGEGGGLSFRPPGAEPPPDP